VSLDRFTPAPAAAATGRALAARRRPAVGITGPAGIVKWRRLLRRRGAATLLIVARGVLAVLAVGCASLANTPAQDLAWSRWAACRTQVTGAELNWIQLDGRIAFWYGGPSDGQAMLECLGRAAKDGPALPAPTSESRPSGGGGDGGM